MIHAESNFQQAVVRFLRLNGFYCFSVPNGTKLSHTQARVSVREGVLSGVSDIIIVLKNRVVFAEFKSPTGTGRQSAAQKDFQKEVTDRGHEYVIWSDWKPVEKFINENKGDK